MTTYYVMFHSDDSNSPNSVSVQWIFQAKDEERANAIFQKWLVAYVLKDMRNYYMLARSF